MGFFVGLIVNTVLLSVPIGATLGTLFAVRPFQQDRKQTELVQSYDHILTTSICGEFHEFAQNKHGNNFTINSNEILEEDDSTLCMTYTKLENSTYATGSTTPDYSFTWSYPFVIANKSTPANQTAQPLMHAFPQISIAEGGSVPLKLSDLGQLTLGMKWTMGTGNTVAPETSELRLGANQVNASVALDMYLDADESKASNAGKAAFELVVHLAKFGLQHPVGFGNGTVVKTETFAGAEYDLFMGQNSNKQNVFSWIPHRPVTTLDNVEFSDFFKSVITLSDKQAKQFKVTLPTYDLYLGYVGFGTQAYNAHGNVTFGVRDMEFNVRKFGDEGN